MICCELILYKMSLTYRIMADSDKQKLCSVLWFSTLSLLTSFWTDLCVTEAMTKTQIDRLFPPPFDAFMPFWADFVSTWSLSGMAVSSVRGIAAPSVDKQTWVRKAIETGPPSATPFPQSNSPMSSHSKKLTSQVPGTWLVKYLVLVSSTNACPLAFTETWLKEQDPFRSGNERFPLALTETLRVTSKSLGRRLLPIFLQSFQRNSEG